MFQDKIVVLCSRVHPLKQCHITDEWRLSIREPLCWRQQIPLKCQYAYVWHHIPENSFLWIIHIYGMQPFIFLKILKCDKLCGFRMYVFEVISLLPNAEYHDQNSFEIEFYKMSVFLWPNPWSASYFAPEMKYKEDKCHNELWFSLSVKTAR